MSRQIDAVLARYEINDAPYRANVESFAGVLADWRAFTEQVDRISAALQFPDAEGAARVLQDALNIIGSDDARRLGFQITHVGVALSRRNRHR